MPDALAFTRSIGDFHLQSYGVSHVPDVLSLDLTDVFQRPQIDTAAAAAASAPLLNGYAHTHAQGHAGAHAHTHTSSAMDAVMLPPPPPSDAALMMTSTVTNSSGGFANAAGFATPAATPAPTPGSTASRNDLVDATTGGEDIVVNGQSHDSMDTSSDTVQKAAAAPSLAVVTNGGIAAGAAQLHSDVPEEMVSCIVACSDGIWDNWGWDEVGAFFLHQARVAQVYFMASSDTAVAVVLAVVLLCLHSASLCQY